ncbi:MAG TPA: TonB-dependent receptor [Longimicrobiaceae bacterium]|nr:TonB-dependent receptor [Longimicrobiaceae bacterium]
MYLTRLRRKLGAALLACAGLLAASQAEAQGTPYTVQGTVVNAASEPVANAAVTVSGTQLRTATGANGQFTLSAPLQPGSYTLQISAPGRGQATRTLALGAEQSVQLGTVTLQESAFQLDELVVTGTGAPTARRALGNAVATVSAEQLAQSPATSIDAALAGKIPGAQVMSNSGQPGGGISVRLRGTSSITGGAEPLYIIDGVIVDNDSEDTGINFGSRSNPTNRLGDLNPNDIERVEVLKGAAAAALYGSRANNGVIQIFTKRGRSGELRVSAETRVSQGTLPKHLGLNLYPFDATGAPVQRFDNERLIYRDAWSNDSYVSVSGGAENTQFYLSGSYTDQQGIMKGSDHEKVSVRLNLDQQLGGWLNISGGANYIASSTGLVINGEQGVGGLLTAVVFTPTTIDFSAINPETGRYAVRQTTFPNPLEVIDDWSAPQSVSRFVGSFQARATPTASASLEYRLGYDTYNMETRLYIPRGTPADPDGGTQAALRDQYLINNDLVGSYLLGVGEALNLTTTAGMNHTFSREQNLSASASDLTPFTELVRGAVQTASQNRFEATTLGFFLQEQAGWNDRLFLTGALRWDASSTFGPEERWQLYPKVSASYVISDESFWQGTPMANWFSSFRLRGALGYAGNQPPSGSAYARYSLYTGITNINRLGLVHEAAAGNPNLKPERQREVEVGFDAGFLDNRVDLSFSYYDQYVTDLLLSRPFAPSSGFGSELANVGELSNRGVELQVNTVNLDRPAFGWNSTINFSRNRNRVEMLEGGDFTDPGSYINFVGVGLPLGAFRTFDYARTANGEIVLDAAGLPVRADSVSVVGDPNPDFQASLLNEFRLGSRLRASFLLDGVFGHDLWNQTQRIMDGSLRGNSALWERELRGEVPAGYANRKSTIAGAYIEDGTYVKLREMSLRYQLDDRVVGRFGLSGVDLELTGRNLYTWTDYSGYDPEINMFGTATVARGTDFAVYPNPRTIGFGVRVNY